MNSIKARLPVALAWLRDAAPDVVLLQEIKCIDEMFPRLEIEDLGYNVSVAGQKTYNGVAVLSKRPIEVECTALPGDDDDVQARYLEVLVGDVRVASVYLPNGNPAVDEDGRDSAKYAYKLAWMERLYEHVRALLATEDAFVLGGDFNVIPEDGDVYDPAAWKDDALFRPETRAAWRKILHLGVTDAFRALHTDVGRYSYWGYQRGAWNKDHGLRIDHMVLSPQAVDRLRACDIDKGPRAAEKASDHTPVWCDLAD